MENARITITVPVEGKEVIISFKVNPHLLAMPASLGAHVAEQVQSVLGTYAVSANGEGWVK